MINEQRHFIHTRSIQIGVERQDIAAHLMDEASSLWATHLAVEADAVFSTCCPPSKRIRLERIELNLGTIPEAMFAELLPARFRTALEAEVREQLSAASTERRGSRDVAPAEHSILEVIEYTLLHGILPWWASTEIEPDPEGGLTEALRRTPDAVAALVQKIGRHERVRFRLVRWLADPEIMELIRAVVRSDADFILNYAADLDQRQHDRSILPAGSEEFRHAKWEVLLGHLLAERGSRFNAKSFLQQTLHELAARFGFKYTDLIAQLADSAAHLPLSWRDASLPQLLLELHSEDAVEQSKLNGRDDNARAVDRWLAKWDEALGERPHHWTAKRLHSLAFWASLPDAMTRKVTAILRDRYGNTEAFARLLVTLAPEDREAWHGRLQATDSHRRANENLSVAPLADRLTGAINRAAESVRRDIFTGEEPAACAIELSMPALRLLLETGALPPEPWASRWHQQSDAWLHLTLAQHADSAPSLLRTWARSGRLTATMAAQLSDPALTAIVETVEPAHADEVLHFFRATERENAIRPLAPGMQGAEAFRRSVWQVILDYLLSDRGSVFNTCSFLEHNIAQLAARHQTDVATLVAFLAHAAQGANCPALYRDLRELEARQTTSLPDSPTDVVDEGMRSENKVRNNSDAFSFTADKVRRSPLVRLQLLRIVLSGESSAQASRFESLLPLLWDELRTANRHEPWRELMQRSTWDASAAERIQRTGGERLLHAVFFEDSGAQAETWEDDITWMENSSAAADLFPDGRSGLRAHLWRTAAELWREGSGRPFNDVSRLLVRVLARLGGAGIATGASPAERERESLTKLKTALTRDGSSAATRMSARLHEQESDRKLILRPGDEIYPATNHGDTSGAKTPTETPPARRNGSPVSREPAAHPDSSFTPPKYRRDGDKTDQSRDDGENPRDRFEPMAVTNAGLVLLAPLFPELHRRCNLLDERLFVDFKAAHRAVHLLQYLVFEGARTHEYSLALNKVLCGLEPDTPVSHEQLTADEKAATAALLEGAIRRWPRSAVVSAEGLRSSYLRRPGKLQRKGNGWLLTVEKRGWDVLLPELPWCFPGLRPAWMPLPLEVDWI